MRIDVFMQELSYEKITQQAAYDIINLLGRLLERNIGLQSRRLKNLHIY